MTPAVLFAAALAAAVAAPVDYSFEEAHWNGLGYLLTTAAEAKVEVEVVDTLDLERLRPSDVLFVFYPAKLDADAIHAFIRDGGHVILADDRGDGAELLRRLGVRRNPRGPSRHASWYQGMDGMPVLHPQLDHFLFFNVDEVVANYPAAMAGAGEPVLSFDDPNERLVVEVRVGRGALLAIGDASLFLNQMLRRFYGNKQFAANALRYYCERDPCALKVLGPTATTTGSYRPRRGPLGDLPQIFDDVAASVDETFGNITDALAKPPWSVLLGWLSLLLGLALAARVMALGRERVPAPVGSLPPVVAPPAVAEAMGLAGGGSDADFCDLAQVLVAEVEHLSATGRLPAELDAPPAAAGVEDPDVRVARRALLRIRDQTASLQAAAPPMVSAERFVRLYDQVRAVTRYVESRQGQRPRQPTDRRTTAR